MYNVKVTWVIPSTRANGQPLLLSELAGYEIYYVLDGLDPSVPDTKIVVNGGSSTSYNITGLAAGIYDFAISAVDTNGVKSSLSGVVVVNIGM